MIKNIISFLLVLLTTNPNYLYAGEQNYEDGFVLDTITSIKNSSLTNTDTPKEIPSINSNHFIVKNLSAEEEVGFTDFTFNFIIENIKRLPLSIQKCLMDELSLNTWVLKIFREYGRDKNYLFKSEDSKLAQYMLQNFKHKIACLEQVPEQDFVNDLEAKEKIEGETQTKTK